MKKSKKNAEEPEELDPIEILKQDLKENWLNILDTAKEYNKTGIFTKTTASIPFIPLESPIEFFHYVWRDFHSLFMNSNGNSLEIIVPIDIKSNKNKVKMYLHKANQEGMFYEMLSIKKFPNDFSIELLEDPEKIFEIFRPFLKKQEKIDLGNVRIYSENFIDDLLAIFSETLNYSINKPFFPMIGQYLDSFLKAKANKQFLVFPEFPLKKIIESWRSILSNIDFVDIGQEFQNFFPPAKFTLSFTHHDYSSNFLISQGIKGLKITSLPEYIPENKDDKFIYHRAIISNLNKKYHCSANFLINMDRFGPMINEICTMPYPLEKSSQKLLIQQKLLDFYHDIGRSWMCSPEPILFKDQPRFWLYSIGYRINFKKLAYWAIPTYFEKYFKQFIGLNGKCLLFIGKSLKFLNDSENLDKIKAVLIQRENGIVKRIERISSNQIQQIIKRIKPLSIENGFTKRIELNQARHILNEFRIESSSQFGFISQSYWISENLIRGVFEEFNKFHSKSWFIYKHLLKIIKLIRDPSQFSVVPENPVLSSLFNKSNRTLLKKIGVMFTDLNEF
ncbi:MAG: hypothetical protein ACTSVU_08415 [Promethearchaeota archaeon]